MSQDPIAQFRQERTERIASYAKASDWKKTSNDWIKQAFDQKHMYNFEIMGRPIIQTPMEIVAIQELIWDVKPDLVIETGIAHGGSLIWSAACLAMVDYAEAFEQGTTLDPRAPGRRVLGIDIDIREHNRKAIEAHPMAPRIDMILGSSVSQETMDKVKTHTAKAEKVMVFLDSNHTYDHVIAELELYAPLTTKGSYCVVFDTIVEDLPKDFFKDRPWNPGNSPKTAVHTYLQRLENEGRTAADGGKLQMQIDHEVNDKLLITAAPDGYLKRV